MKEIMIYTEAVGAYLKLGQGCFLPDPSQFIVYNYPSIEIYITCE